MVDQPGAGGSRSYKIRGYTRERQSAKPYARPPGKRKGVIETVKDFFSPAWLVDLFKGNQRSQPVVSELDEQNEFPQTIEESYPSSYNARSSSESTELSTTTTVGNGQLRSVGTGYFSSLLRERGLSSETPSTSRPSRTFGLSSGNYRFGETSTSAARSGKSDSDVLSESVQAETIEEQEGDLSIAQDVRQEASTSVSIETSTPALFLNPGSKRRANTSIFGEPLPATEASTSGRGSQARPQLFPPSSEYHPGPQPFSLPKNRPTFSVSAFGSTIQPKPPQAGEFSSPFYHGRTSFGGASSLHSAGYKRLRTNSPTLGEATQPVRKVITPKPVSRAGSSGVTSQTAKRILEALENMSSPLIDARKIPTPPISPSASPLSFSPAKRKRPPIPSRAVGSPRSLKAHFPGPPVQDLSAPQQASISKLRAKETVTSENIATPSTSLFSTASTTIPTFSKPSVPSFTSTPLPISLSPSSSNTKVGGKVKSARSTSHYTQREKMKIFKSDDRGDSEVNLIPEVTTAVPLQLPNGKSLPSFSFAPTSQMGKTNSPSTEMSVSANATPTVDLTKNNFKFSAPATKVPAFSQELSTVSQSNSNRITFSFSQPTPVNKSDTVNDDKPFTDLQGRSVVLEVKQTDKPMEPNNNLFNKFAPLPGSWECDTCLVSNKATDTKCVACESSKPSIGKPVPPKKPAPVDNDLLQKFAPVAGSWSCDSSMLNNSSSKTKGVACETPKPVVKPPLALTKPVNNTDTDVMKKFAPPADSWSCDTSLVSNKSKDSTSVACQSPKPGATSTTLPSFGVPTNAVSDSSLAAKFAPPSGSWECDTCMVNNKGGDTTCAACQTPKPGTQQAAAITTGGFSFVGGQTSSSSPFKFGVNNSSETNSSAGSSVKFGLETKSSTGGPSFSSPFKFGTNNKSASDSSASVTFTFGASNTDQNQKTDSEQAESSNKLPVTFRFGTVPAKPSESQAGQDKTSTAPSFSFGSSAVNHDGKDQAAKAPMFTFGASSSSDMNKAASGSLKLGDASALSKEDKPNSIAAAAASGFLKVPAVKRPDQSSSQPAAGVSIADAAKAGFLKVLTAGEKKDDFPSPPNVNLFARAQNSSVPTVVKPDSVSGFTFAVPSATPTGVSFGSTSSTAGPLAQGSLGAAGSTFQFGGPTNSAPSAESKVEITPAPTPSPLSFPVNTTSTAVAPFSFIANAAPTTTTAGTFSFASNTASTAAAAAPAATFQFAPSVQAPSFQFGVANTAPVTTAAQQVQQAFGITSTPASSSSETVKQFPFNSGSTAQGFNFAPSNSPAATFNFGGSTAKQPAFAGFGVVQSSSNQQEATNSPAATFNFEGSTAKQPAFPEFGASQSSSNQQGAKQTPAFPGFASANPQASVSPFVFASASNSTSAPSEETMEADGNNSGTNLFASSANATATPFGSSGPSTGFAFGAPTPPASGGFNFTAAQTNAGSTPFAFAPAVGGTPAFGANITPAATAPASAGFNFAPVATNNSMGSPAMFNFTGTQPQAPAMFTAGTGGDTPGIAGRKFKKAVRRTNKR